MNTKEQLVSTAMQINRALQLFAQLADMPDEQRMEISGVYPLWAAQKAYAAGDIVKHGVNADGETQLYRAAQSHTSQEGWEPDKVPALFSKIGFTESGVPIWTQPLGGHDAYMKGDIVEHKGKRWKSDADGNVWEPGVYGWSGVV